MNKYSIRIKQLLDQAALEDGVTAKQVLEESARIIGAHATMQARNHDDVTAVMQNVVEQVTRGVTAGVLLQHGATREIHFRLVQVGR